MLVLRGPHTRRRLSMAKAYLNVIGTGRHFDECFYYLKKIDEENDGLRSEIMQVKALNSVLETLVQELGKDRAELARLADDGGPA